MSKVVVITGGGTGGHLKIADVFISEFKKRGFEVVFIGSSYGQDKFWFENDDRLKEKIFLNTSGVVNKRGIFKIFSLLNIFYKAIFCLKILKNIEYKSLYLLVDLVQQQLHLQLYLKKIAIYICMNKTQKLVL